MVELFTPCLKTFVELGKKDTVGCNAIYNIEIVGQLKRAWLIGNLEYCVCCTVRKLKQMGITSCVFVKKKGGEEIRLETKWNISSKKENLKIMICCSEERI